MAWTAHGAPTVRRASLVLFLVLAVPGPASADAHACASRATPRWIARTQLGLSIPLGAELQARVGLCVPLRPWDGDWLDLAAVEIGALTQISPAYAMGGGYVTLTPVNLLSFRLEALGVGYWPVGIDGAGYYGFAQPNERLRVGSLNADLGTEASGWTIRALVTLQAHIPFEGVALLVRDTVSGERTSIGSEAYFINLYTGLTQRASDLTVGNDAYLALEIPVAGGPSLRVGGYHSVRVALGTSALTHQGGGLFMVGWSRPIAEISWMELGLRGGAYENPSVATTGDAASDVTIGSVDYTIALWSSIEWDLGGL